MNKVRITYGHDIRHWAFMYVQDLHLIKNRICKLLVIFIYVITQDELITTTYLNVTNMLLILLNVHIY